MSGETARRDRIFRRRTAAVLAVLSAVTLAVTLFYLIFPEVPNEIRSVGADTFSVSALGYHALVELLKQDVPVLVSRQDSAHKARPGTPLLVLEPSGRSDRIERLERLLGIAHQRQVTTLVVLPKWDGSPMAERPAWVGQVRLLADAEPAAVLAAALGGDEIEGEVVVRPRRPGTWSGELTELGIEPEIVRAPQLLRTETLRDRGMSVVLGSDHGALVMRSQDDLLWVVSDPDVLNTAGLAQGDNPVLARALLVGLLEPESLVVDEVLHDYGQQHNLWRALIRFPLICVTLHMLALFALLLWATTSRFGQPLPAPSRLPPGKLTLLDSTARLLSLGGDVKHSLERYLELTVRRAAMRWGVAAGSVRQQVKRLGALGKSRDMREDLEQLATRIVRWPATDTEPRKALALARGLHRWRKEMSPLRGADATHDGPG